MRQLLIHSLSLNIFYEIRDAGYLHYLGLLFILLMFYSMVNK